MRACNQDAQGCSILATLVRVDDGDPRLLVTSHQPLLGTAVELRIAGPSMAVAVAEALVLDEIRRLERMFSAFVETSELCRWRRGEIDDVSEEFSSLLRVALRWQNVGAGAFNPAVGALSRLWTSASDAGCAPDANTLIAVAARIAEPSYRFDGDAIERVHDCNELNFNAVAKGYIVDLAAAAAMGVGGVESIVINAGGDLVHCGSGSVAIGIENPSTPYDNAPPLAIIDVSGRGVATSGSTRRGIRVGSRWFSHVIDPRSGWPVGHIRSASVVADDACTADAVATIVGVMVPADSLAFVRTLADVSCCLVDDAGVVWRSEHWSDYERS